MFIVSVFWASAPGLHYDLHGKLQQLKNQNDGNSKVETESTT